MAEEMLRDPQSMQGVVPHTMMWYLPIGDLLNIV